ncbi:MAG: alkaline phosphatase family protein [Chitinophagaceae bacterium]|nr:alkaline phosphatase family protein [Chitinophagaceae bacterium]
MRNLSICLLFLSLEVFAGKIKKNEGPKLMVGIVVDQMRPDYLARFRNRLSENGFLRLMRDGHDCANTYINYLPSYTGPGHACIYTGSVPAFHGIASNDWIDRITGLPVYCTSDPKSSAIGGTQKAGRMSPVNMWANTITDELRLQSNFRSKVIAVSVKDRASILPGGHTASAAYWMDDSNGVFMSSSFYMSSLPDWVIAFNQRNLAKTYMQQDWNSLYPINTYHQSSEDQNAYEGKFTGELTTTFPHKTATLRLNDIKRTPWGNSIVSEFAKTAIEKEKLGQGEETDFLCISYSSTDYVGHMYGPNSIEIEDTYLRLDAEIAALLNYLDETVGAGQYTVFLTADHGVAHNPQYLIDRKVPAGFFFGDTLKQALNKSLALTYGSNTIIRSVAENFIWFSDSTLNAMKLNRDKIANDVMSLLRSNSEIQFAFDMHHINDAVVPNPIREMAINGYVPNRSGDILLLLKPAWLDAYALTGTTHGTWNPYDTHIPLIWYGWGIKPGITYRDIHMTDIAATIASLLRIQMPNACIGKTIPEVIK